MTVGTRFLSISLIFFSMLFGFVNQAEASHFRYGNITWTIPDPVGAPRTVRFTVETAWRADFIGATQLEYGDGTNNGNQTGTASGMGVDALGNPYVVQRYTATHTYAADGGYTAFFASGDRVAGLINGANGLFRVETRVAVGGGNTAGPVSSSTAIINLQVGGIRTYTFPIVDVDGDVTTCRLGTNAETGINPATPSVPAGGAMPSVAAGPGGCVLTWNLGMAVVGQQYVVHVVLESTHAGVISSTQLDLIVQIVLPPPPVCSGGGTFVANVGALFSHSFTGTRATPGSLTVTAVGMPSTAILVPASGSSGASPFGSTFNWTPIATDAGTTRVVQINYGETYAISGGGTGTLTGTCYANIQVPQCPLFGNACSVGVGSCRRTGTNVCAGIGITVCSVTAGAPVPETCDGADNDCDGTTDNGTATASCNDSNACTTDTCGGAGACVNTGLASGLPGSCAMGLVCSGAPTNVCRALCGDGIVIVPTETCDDNNTAGGDGCNTTCRREVVITTPLDAALTNDNTPTISGTADAGSVITVMIGGQTLMTTANAAGNWSVTPTALIDGAQTASARAVDTLGGASTDSVSFMLDTVTLVAITAPAMSSSSTNTMPMIRGTGEPGAMVMVLVDMGVIATVTVAADGTWSTTVPSALGDGTHRIDVIATDRAGNVADSTVPSMGAVPVTFIVDTRTAVDITGPVGTTRDSTPAITGTGEVGAMIAITLTGPMGMMSTGTATVGAGGTWTFTAPMLADGAWTTSVTATDLLGNMATDTQPFTVDATTRVDFVQPVESGISGDATPDLSGTGEPGASVEVRIDGMVVGTVIVDAEGNWTFQVPTDLTDGPHTVLVTATDTSGNTATDMGTFTVDTTMPVLEIRGPGDSTTTADTTPTVTGMTEPGLTVTVVIDGTTLGTVVAGPDGSWSLPVTTPLSEGPHTVLATTVDAAGNTARDQHAFAVDTTAPMIEIVRPIDGAAIRDNTPTIRGTTEPNACVQVFVDGDLIGTVTADASGAWTIDVTATLTDGAHTMRAVATDDAGNTATDNGGFIIDRTTRVDFLQPGTDGPIGDATPDLSGTGEPGASVAVTIDGMLVGTATVDAEGNWTLQVPTALADGPHAVSVTATNDVGGMATDTGMFVVDTDAPALEIRNPGDNSTTSDTTPTITGSAHPGATVSVYVDGVFLGTAITNADGTWSLPVTMALGEGVHTVFATTTDAAGLNAFDQHDFMVDTTSPAVAVIAPSGRIADATPTLRGTSEPNASVEVFVDGVRIATVTAGADGNWSIDATTLADGEHTVRAVVTDEAGNVATDSGAFIVDTATTVAIVRPADGGTVGSAVPTYTGTAEPGATVTVSVDGAELGTAVAGGDGRWFFTQPAALTAGMHTVTAHAVDTVGNEADTDADFTFDPTMLDSDGDGILDSVECPVAGSCPDTDMDGMPDQLDPDDDGDGVPTAIECATGTMCPDSDMDGRSDYLDPDDDGDGRPTRDERPGMISIDTDGDGSPDYLDTDDDGDGLPTSSECMSAPCRDTDTDGRPDFLDADDDNDGILTARERADGMRIGMGGDDVDSDEIPNWLDTNSDGDLIDDRDEGLRDTDLDGRPDYLDPNIPTPRPDAGMPGADTGPRADVGAGDAGIVTGEDAGRLITGGLSGGACGCSAAGSASRTNGLWIFGLAALGLAARRRRDTNAARS